MSWYSRPVNLPRYVDPETAVMPDQWWGGGGQGTAYVTGVGLPCVESFAGRVSWTDDDGRSWETDYRSFLMLHPTRIKELETCPNTLM